MKTLITVALAAALLPLSACGKKDGADANVVSEEATGNADTFGNEDTFASDNVIVPQENATDVNVLDVAPTNGVDPANSAGNTN